MSLAVDNIHNALPNDILSIHRQLLSLLIHYAVNKNDTEMDSLHEYCGTINESQFCILKLALKQIAEKAGIIWLEADDHLQDFASFVRKGTTDGCHNLSDNVDNGDDDDDGVGFEGCRNDKVNEIGNLSEHEKIFQKNTALVSSVIKVSKKRKISVPSRQKSRSRERKCMTSQTIIDDFTSHTEKVSPVCKQEIDESIDKSDWSKLNNLGKHGQYTFLFVDEWGIQKHIYNCDLCNFDSLDIQIFANHMKQNHNISTNVYECHECDACFTNYRFFKKHRDNHLKVVSQQGFYAETDDDEDGAVADDTEDYEEDYVLTDITQQHVEEDPTIPRAKSQFGRFIYYFTSTAGTKEKINYCDQCGFDCKVSSTFAKHMKEQHCIEDGYECVQCDESFCDYVKLTTHAYRHHRRIKEDTLEQCKFSPWIFFTPSSNGKLEKVYRCNQCSYKSKRSETFSDHLFKSHDIIDGYSCHKCCYTTPSGSCLRKHLYSHRKLYIALPENGVPVNKGHLQLCNSKKYVHIYHHIDGSKAAIYKCDVCKFRTDIITYFAEHMQLHGSDENERNLYECHECDLNFAEYNLFNKHALTHATKQQKTSRIVRQNGLKCNLCNYMAANQKFLDDHMLRHKGTYPFLCHKCDFMARRKTTLTNHLASKHGEGKLRKLHCDDKGCSFSTYYVSSLKKHKTKHGGTPGRHCPTCGYIGWQTSDFARHVKLHLGMKEFQCPFCDYMDYDQQSIRRHMVQHTNMYEFACQYCSKTVTTAHALKRHIMGHEGIKPWQCSACESCYIVKEKLKKHILTKHSGEAQVVENKITKINAQVKRKVSQYSSEVIRVNYGYREIDEGSLELYVSGRQKVGQPEVFSVQCSLCPYTCRSNNAFILHKIMDHTDCLHNLPPITDETRRVKFPAEMLPTHADAIAKFKNPGDLQILELPNGDSSILQLVKIE